MGQVKDCKYMVRIAKQTRVLCLPYKGLLSSASALSDIFLVLSQEVGSVGGDPSNVGKESKRRKQSIAYAESGDFLAFRQHKVREYAYEPGNLNNCQHRPLMAGISFEKKENNAEYID